MSERIYAAGVDPKADNVRGLFAGNDRRVEIVWYTAYIIDNDLLLL
jgi:hypothetical protein